MNNVIYNQKPKPYIDNNLSINLSVAELESKLLDLFKQEKIQKCTTRWCTTVKNICNSEEEYRLALCTRLEQGGIKC